MKMGKSYAAAMVLAVLCVPSHGQVKVRITQDAIIGKVVECMSESAPRDWRQLVFTLDQESPDPENPGKAVASHKAAGKADKAPREIKPCRRPDWVSKAVQRFRELQDEKARLWTGITLTLERDGRYTINYRYPK
jgi:hypothetical protein